MDGVSYIGSSGLALTVVVFVLKSFRPPSDNVRNQSKAAHPDRVHSDRSKLPLLDQTNRRPALERHISRGTASMYSRKESECV